MSNLNNPQGSRIGKANPAAELFPDSPAFPFVVDIPHPLDPKQMTRQVFVGVSVRDYFACAAMATAYNSFHNGSPDSARTVADWCYRIADAMLEARKPFNDSQFHEDHMKPRKP